MTPPIAEYQVYVQGSRMRRVIRALGGRVYYSVGSDCNRTCLLRTFQCWARKAALVYRRAGE